MADAEIHDLFLSYRYALGEQVRPLVEALRARGLRVWQDRSDIEELASIQRSIRDGLARSRALLVWYSADYNDSRACQWELTSAYLAAQADRTTSGDVLRRILVVNPQPGLPAQVVLPELFGQLHLNASELSVDELAEHIVTRLAQTVPAAPLGELRALTPPRMLPNGLLGSTRFVGRLAPMWQVHRALQSGETALLTGRDGSGQTGLVQVRGAGGIGKSLLAEEYALRFGAAYPGGIFWIRAEGYTDRDEEISPTERLSRLEGQLIDFALRLNLPEPTPEKVIGLLAGHFGRQGQPFLWIVDDLPADPGSNGLAPWLAPHPLGRTLITTRARRFNHVSRIELPQLGNDEALRLLSRGKLLSEADHASAQTICRELGYHALAVDVAAALIEQRGFANFLGRLQQASTDKDVLEVAARLDEALPNGHQRSIAATLLASIRELDEPTLDVLRLAALLAPTPIPRDLIWRSIAYADDLEPDDAQDLCDPAISRAKSSSLADPADAGGIVVHTLVSRTMRLHEPDESCTESLRTAVVAVLNEELPRVTDIRAHVSLKEWIAHAQQIGDTPRNIESTRLLGWISNFYFVRGQYRDSIDVSRRQIKVLNTICGSEHVATLEASAFLGRALRRVGKLQEASTLHGDNFAIATKTLGSLHPLTITILGDLAAVLWSQGRWQEARSLQEVAREMMPRIQGQKHPSTLTALSNLAVTLFSCGAFQEAKNIHENVLAS